MHLILIRHGQSTNNMLEAAMGDSPEFLAARKLDPALSQLGERQAECLGRHVGEQLAAYGGSPVLICSHMARAMQTAAPLAARLGLRARVDPRWVEVHGFYLNEGGKSVAHAGPARADVQRRFPAFDASAVPEAPVPALESRAAAEARAASLASDLRQMARSVDEAQLVIVVAHADLINLVGKALLLPQGCAATMNLSYWCLNNTGLVHLIVHPNGSPTYGDATQLYWNRSDHLSEDLRAGVAFKTHGVDAGAAGWARVGEGGTHLPAAFDEAKVVAVRPWTLRPSGALTAALVVAAASLLAVAVAGRGRGQPH